VLCVCGPNTEYQCVAQQNQCLDPAHCSVGVCHPDLHVCTECVDDSLCLDASRPRCRADGICVECLNDAECSGATPICNIIPLSPAESTCVECMRDSDCSDGGGSCSTFLGQCQ
jgi:hypothetical protein